MRKDKKKGGPEPFRPDQPLTKKEVCVRACSCVLIMQLSVRVCSACAVRAQLHEVRLKERASIQQIMKDQSKSAAGANWYMLDNVWLDQWKAFAAGGVCQRVRDVCDMHSDVSTRERRKHTEEERRNGRRGTERSILTPASSSGEHRPGSISNWRLLSSDGCVFSFVSRTLVCFTFTMCLFAAGLQNQTW